jgi:hypothetical protein
VRKNDTLSFLVRGFVRLPKGGDRESSTNHTAHWERRKRNKGAAKKKENMRSCQQITAAVIITLS